MDLRQPAVDDHYRWCPGIVAAVERPALEERDVEGLEQLLADHPGAGVGGGGAAFFRPAFDLEGKAPDVAAQVQVVDQGGALDPRPTRRRTR